jgi:hypothetical protein
MKNKFLLTINILVDLMCLQKISIFSSKAKYVRSLIFVLFWTVSVAFADNISVSVSQKKVSLNDSFTVIFSTTQSVKGQPDFSPLEENFDILSSSQEFNTSIINGSVSQVTRWKLVLMAKQEGTLAIPSIHFGKEESSSQLIEVSHSSPTKQDDAIFLETDLQPDETAFEQTPLIYTVRLYTSVAIPQASLSDLKVSDPEAIIEQLGDEKEFEHYGQSGKRYTVIERRYTVIPQHVGELTFLPILFEGRVMTGRNSFFDYQTQVKRIVSDQKTIKIHPIPPEFQKSNWLAANDIKFSEEWSADPSKMVVGEPNTLTLRIEAQGAHGHQIPDITLQVPSGLKHYGDKAEVSTQERGDRIVGMKQIKIALIGTKVGDFDLPDMRLKWWDLTTDQVKETVLPKRTIRIEADVVAMNDEISDQTQMIVDQKSDESKILPLEVSTPLPFWVWILVAINAFLLIGYCLVFLYKKINIRAIKPEPMSHAKAKLKDACLQNNAKMAAAYLIQWASPIFPEVKPLNIVSIKERVPDNFGNALEGLNRALYGGNATCWSGEVLWQVIRDFKPKKRANKEKKLNSSILQDLYPK